MNEIYFVAILPDFNNAVEIEHKICHPPCKAIKYKDRLNKKYGADIFKVYKVIIDDIEEVA